MRIFQRFIFALGDGEHRHLVALTEIEAGRADQIADVLDKHNAAVVQRQALHRIMDHLCVQVTAFAGVDLDRRGAGGADPLGVIHGLLIAFDHCAGHAML